MMFFKELKKNTLSTAFTGMSDAFYTGIHIYQISH